MISLRLTGTSSNRSADLPLVVAVALAETTAWCSDDSLRSAKLRSPILDPSSVLMVQPFDELGLNAWSAAKRHSYQQATELVQRRRSELVCSAAVQLPTTAEAKAKGRLLLYEPMETVSDGAAASSSLGFFDDEDAPPWDTWFWYAKGTIFSWVPNALVRDVQAGIDANPVDCIHWADWSRLPLIL